MDAIFYYSRIELYDLILPAYHPKICVRFLAAQICFPWQLHNIIQLEEGENSKAFQALLLHSTILKIKLNQIAVFSFTSIFFFYSNFKGFIQTTLYLSSPVILNKNTFFQKEL
jgi:hypothetical protein